MKIGKEERYFEIIFILEFSRMLDHLVKEVFVLIAINIYVHAVPKLTILLIITTILITFVLMLNILTLIRQLISVETNTSLHVSNKFICLSFLLSMYQALPLLHYFKS